MYLLDTNALINYLNAFIPASAMQFMHGVVDEFCHISIISKMETLGFNFSSQAEQNTMETFITGATILTINEDIVNQPIAIRISKKIKLPDAIVAATALVYNLTLVTRNIADFKNIPGLKVIDSNSL